MVTMGVMNIAWSNASARRIGMLAAFLALMTLTWGAKDFVMPRANSAKTYPARDEHANEKVTVAADPYDTGDKAAIFNGDYREHGMLPVLLVITNDGDDPVSLASMKVELITYNKSKLQPAQQDDIYRRMSGSFKRPDRPSPVPLPLPRRKAKSALSGRIRDEVDAAIFKSRAVEGHGTQYGFVFFDVGDLNNPLAGARMFVSGVRTGVGQELWFFEIPMEKYLTARP
jgi:hypothetical protein